MRNILTGLLITCFGAFISPQYAQSSEIITQTCNLETYQGQEFYICRFRNDNKNLKLYFQNPEGKNYGTFANLRKQLKHEGQNLIFAMNGGMYHPNREPVGLYIEEYRLKSALNTTQTTGNFGLLPNGVFVINNGISEVLETTAYQAKYQNHNPQFSTQSGPMLVIDNKIHPAFNKESQSLKIRNGVGISQDGTELYFAITKTKTNFYDFAAIFKDYLKSPNALYLDGTISKGLYRHTKLHKKRSEKMGVIIAISKIGD